MEDEFKVLIDKLPVLFETLANVPLKPWNNLGSLPQNGIYVFYENERPIYIGRSNRMKDRIKEEEGDILYCPCQERKRKTFIFYKNNNLENWFDCGNIPPFESLYGFASDSTNLSPTTNSESQRYHYPVCPAKAGPPSILYPDSKVQREAQHCPVRGLQ